VLIFFLVTTSSICLSAVGAGWIFVLPVENDATERAGTPAADAVFEGNLSADPPPRCRLFVEVSAFFLFTCEGRATLVSVFFSRGVQHSGVVVGFLFLPALMKGSAILILPEDRTDVLGSAPSLLNPALSFPGDLVL